MGSLLRRSAHHLFTSSSSYAPSRHLIAALRRFSSADAAAGKEDLEPFDQRKLPADYDHATFDPAAPPSRAPPSDRVWRLVDEVSVLSLAEVAELTCILRDKMGIKEAPVIGIMNAGGGGGGGGAPAAAAAGKEEKKEKTVFDLKLESYDAAAKIKVIKEVRGFTDLGLKEAKELVEKAPAVIKSGVSKEDAEKMIEKMKAVGAKVVME